MHRLVALLLVGLLRLVTGVRARWVGSVPSIRPRIYFANHSSHLDSLVIWAALPPDVRRRTRPVAARDYWGESPFRRYLARRVFNAIFIDRNGGSSSRETLNQILDAIGEDYSLIFSRRALAATARKLLRLSPAYTAWLWRGPIWS
nr:lysophospholipid acyltransferase family protein [Alkalilimnicola ehrlichii]